MDNSTQPITLKRISNPKRRSNKITRIKEGTITNNIISIQTATGRPISTRGRVRRRIDQEWTVIISRRWMRSIQKFSM
jgi:hypothetical protein